MHGVPGVFLALLTRSKISDQLIQPARGILFYHVPKKVQKKLWTTIIVLPQARLVTLRPK